MASSPSVTFLCSPNNPTGLVEPEANVRAVLAMVEAHGPGLLVADEAYGQFADWSALGLVDEETPLVVSRTFSKTWSMAAARLGYLVAAPEVVAACELVALPYHLGAMTQVAGLLALDHVGAMEERMALVVSERQRIAAALAGLTVTTWPSDANFLLFRPEGRDAREVWSALVDRSVLVRDCSTWPGLTGCLRVTVGLPEENDRFLAALTESL